MSQNAKPQPGAGAPVNGPALLSRKAFGSQSLAGCQYRTQQPFFMISYLEKLHQAIIRSGSVICAGLDPVPSNFPATVRDAGGSDAEQTLRFSRTVIAQTSEHVAAYKLNLAYFESLGAEGLQVFKQVLQAIPEDKIRIADAKRGDVPHTNERYKRAFFDQFDVDAITLSPFMGLDTLTPFLQDARKAVYALVLTSNPGASDFLLKPFLNAATFSEYLAGALRSHSQTLPGTLGMVIGATQHETYAPVMNAYDQAPLLIPGIGAQGGSADDLARQLERHNGLALINASRSLSAFKENDPHPWEQQITDEARRMKERFGEITRRQLMLKPDRNSNSALHD